MTKKKRKKQQKAHKIAHKIQLNFWRKFGILGIISRIFELRSVNINGLDTHLNPSDALQAIHNMLLHKMDGEIEQSKDITTVKSAKCRADFEIV